MSWKNYFLIKSIKLIFSQDRIELMENQLEEAQELAQTSNHKVKISQISVF